MTEYPGNERRAHVCDQTQFVTHLQHGEICKQNKDWVEAILASGVLDRTKMHDDIKKIQEILSSNKTWLVTTLIAVIFICLGTVGYLFREGGFAKFSDVAILKTEVAVIADRQTTVLKALERIEFNQVGHKAVSIDNNKKLDKVLK